MRHSTQVRILGVGVYVAGFSFVVIESGWLVALGVSAMIAAIGLFKHDENYYVKKRGF